MKNIAIIPARSGSKGLKDKNIKMLCGKPMLAYTVEAALSSKEFHTIHVSTDSNKYASIAKKYGADVPFLRSQEMSSDQASSWDVVKEVLLNYKKRGEVFDNVCILQPTSPLRTQQDIIESFIILEKRNAKAVISVTEMEHSPLWSGKLPPDCCLENFIPKDIVDTPRQSLEKYYRLNGAIYICNINSLFLGHSLYGNDSFAYIMKKEHSIDVDDEMDFKYAEFMMKFNKKINSIENEFSF